MKKEYYNGKKIKINKKCINIIRANTKDGEILWKRSNTDEWLTMEQESKKYDNTNCANHYIFKKKISIRELEKYLRKHKHYLPKGTVFTAYEIVKIIL